MNNRYLTISEFARLRNVSIGSLRYYEKLNILTPAYIDPKTRYRYYLPEQLSTLDSIILCIELGIPLKDLKKYIDDNGCIDVKSILINGQKVMQKKISEMNTKLEIIQLTLDNMEKSQHYSDIQGVYSKIIEERFFIEIPFHGDWKNFSKEETKQVKLFQEAQDKGMAPVFPSGIIIHYEKEPVRYAFYFRVLHPDEKDNRIITIPKGKYLCLQADLTFETDIKQLLYDNFPTKDRKMVIISNMLLNRLHFDSRHSEIQLKADC